jgi:hypothetical protein
MTKNDATKSAKATKTTRGSKTVREVPPKAPKRAPREDLVVFAIRLTREERDALHKAAGPAKATKLVRALVVAAGQGDAEAAARLISGK